MSSHVSTRRKTVLQIQAMKGVDKIVALTAYTSFMAALMDDYVDMIIVGDSLGMVAYGFDSTLPVTMDMMVQHGRAVVAGASTACVVIDMPYASYQVCKEEAFRNAATIMAQTGAQAVKLEGGAEMADTVDYLVQRGIPVLAHIGLMPQHANVAGGFKVQGKTKASGEKLTRDANAMQAAGAFSVLLEGVVRDKASLIHQSLCVPTIGIGASPECDGQVLVTEDMLGLFSDYTPSFVEQYANLSAPIRDAFKCFSDDVRSGEFPAAKHCFDG